MSFRCSIGIVTYLGRFESHFKALVRKLYFLFPDYDIIIFINGHYDQVKQIDYLKKVTAFLKRYPNIRYLTNLEHQSIARSWNWMIMMALYDKLLILNDDVIINLDFRRNFENIPAQPDFYLINRSWSQFVISKKVIKLVGWFDERFLGMGWEDHDYIFRLAMKNMFDHNLIPTRDIHGIQNEMAPSTDAGWVKISEVAQDKYSKVNRDFLGKKWYWNEFGPVPDQGSFKVRYPPPSTLEWLFAPKNDVEDMPEYYPLQCLNNTMDKPDKKRVYFLLLLSKTCSYFSSIFWKLRLKLGVGVWLRRVLGWNYDRL